MLTTLPPTEFARAATVLSQAFRDDPLWGRTFPDPDTRPDSLRSMFAGLTKTTVAARGLAETTADIEAVALWLPPGKDMGLVATVKSGFALPRFVMSLPPKDRKRLMAVLQQLEKRKKDLMTDPHWYLAAVGVAPDSQGRGLGSALVQAGIQRADHDNSPIYLETETEGNVAFYRHLGFEVIEEVAATGLDVPVWLMIRYPSA